MNGKEQIYSLSFYKVITYTCYFGIGSQTLDQYIQQVSIYFVTMQYIIG